MTSDDSNDSTPACAPPPATAAEVAAAIAGPSELVEAARQVARRRANVIGLLLREPTREEIAVMEDRGCRCDDWKLVQVAQDFDAFRVRRTHLRGRCLLGRFQGDVEVQPGVRLPSGIYDSTLFDCQVGNDCLIEGVGFAANLIIEREAVLFDVASVTCSGAARFGCGAELPLACEVGGREVPVWAEMTVDAAAVVARNRQDSAGIAAVRQAAEAYVKAITSPVAWVRRGARVLHTERVHDAYIGAAALVDHAHELRNTAVLSSAAEPVRISGGAAVADSVLQWGVHVDGNAIVRRSALLEHSGVDCHATVEDSVIGPNTHVQKGEVTASLVGPFVGFHHQSLLIAAFWPEGKGNIAYGAMVGSNHTGRASDQEVWPGEGVFFGLGSAVRLPANFSEAPYSLVSMGTTTLPQRVAFPFSLIAIPADPLPERVPRAFNEIQPGWVLGENAYGLVRNELKYAKRDKSRRHTIDYKILRPGIMRLVKQARDRLRAVTAIKDVYLEGDIDGLGKNALRESVRLQAIAIYDRCLLRYALRLLLGETEGRLTIPGSAEISHELVAELLPGASLAQRLQRLVEIELENARLVQESKGKDDERGARTIPGYKDAHVAAADDPVVKSAWERAEKTRQRVATVLKG
jgi:hypothetical protein